MPGGKTRLMDCVLSQCHDLEGEGVVFDGDWRESRLAFCRKMVRIPRARNDL